MGEEVLIVVVGQLMPPLSPPAPPLNEQQQLQNQRQWGPQQGSVYVDMGVSKADDDDDRGRSKKKDKKEKKDPRRPQVHKSGQVADQASQPQCLGFAV